MNKSFYITIIIIIVILVGAHFLWPADPVPILDNSQNNLSEEAKTLTDTQSTTKQNKNLMHTITIETNKGSIIFETYDLDAPMTVDNFISLSEKGFYNNLIFHRVKKGFMIQGGDPTGTGRGGPGYTFADELNPSSESYKNGYKRGIVAMANAGPNTNGSQFFIMHQDYPLPNDYSIFGNVISGMEIVDAIANSPVNEQDRPLKDIIILSVTVTEKIIQ